MSQALLLDLDDTLLRNSMEDFLPPYFAALRAAVSAHVEPEPFLRAMRQAFQRMVADTDPTRTNEAVFWAEFEPLLPVDRATLEPLLARFYDETFATLSGTTAPVPGSQALLDAARAAGWRIAIATNPVYPLRAIQHRIAWAGLDEAQVDLVTAYEIMTSTKPHAAYYAQVAEMLEVTADACVMAGNHLANDLVGAAAVGMATFWVTPYAIADADFTPDAQGTLDDLRLWLFDA